MAERTNPAYGRRSNPVHLRHLHATILGLMGLDQTKLTSTYLGLDLRLTDVDGKTDLVDTLRKA